MAYKPSANLTVDEQLDGFRGRCSFKQYIPSKPDPYGIKILWLMDAENSYPLKGEVYVGKQPDEEVAVNYGCKLVQRLSAKYLNKEQLQWTISSAAAIWLSGCWRRTQQWLVQSELQNRIYLSNSRARGS